MQSQAEGVFDELVRSVGIERAEDLLKFWRDHRLDSPLSAQQVEDFFFQEVSA